MTSLRLIRHLRRRPAMLGCRTLREHSGAAAVLWLSMAHLVPLLLRRDLTGQQEVAQIPARARLVNLSSMHRFWSIRNFAKLRWRRTRQGLQNSTAFRCHSIKANHLRKALGP